MDRAARLEFCQKCTKREFSPQKGIVCSLTKEHATFDGKCVDYHEDEKEAQLLENKKIIQQNEQQYEDSLGFSRIGIKDGVVVGIIVIVASVLWFLGGLFYLNRIFFYPPILLGLGIFTLVKGINKRKKNKKSDDQILDKEI